MKMEAGLDTGPMLMKGKLPITTETTAQSLHDAMADLGAQMIVEALDRLTQGKLEAVVQPEEGVTYAAKLTREEGLIDWAQPAALIERQVRALNPWPSAFFNWNGETIKVLKAEIMAGQQGQAGTLLDENFTVACGQEAVRLVTVQRAGKKPTDGASFLRGARLPVGSVIA